MLDEHIKCQINRSKVRSKGWSTDQILDQQMESCINRLNLRSLDQMLDQQIKCEINISNVRSTYQELDQQIISHDYRLTDKKIEDHIYFRCTLDAI